MLETERRLLQDAAQSAYRDRVHEQKVGVIDGRAVAGVMSGGASQKFRLTTAVSSSQLSLMTGPTPTKGLWATASGDTNDGINARTMTPGGDTSDGINSRTMSPGNSRTMIPGGDTSDGINSRTMTPGNSRTLTPG